ncbi:12342_t:CDS:2, partial [Dentiscutata erythropus]
FLSNRALEEAISIERSTPLPLEALDCFKVRGLEKNWAEITKDGREEGITPLEHLANHLKQAQFEIETKTDTKDEDIGQEEQ